MWRRKTLVILTEWKAINIVSARIAVVWVFKSRTRSYTGWRRPFRGTCCLHIQGWGNKVRADAGEQTPYDPLQSHYSLTSWHPMPSTLTDTAHSCTASGLSLGSLSDFYLSSELRLFRGFGGTWCLHLRGKCSILRSQLPVATPEKSGSIFLYTILPFKLGYHPWSTANEVGNEGFFWYTVQRVLCMCPTHCSLLNLTQETRSRSLNSLLSPSIHSMLHISFSLTGPNIRLKIFPLERFQRVFCFFGEFTGFTAIHEGRTNQGLTLNLAFCYCNKWILCIIS